MAGLGLVAMAGNVAVIAGAVLAVAFGVVAVVIGDRFAARTARRGRR